MFYYVLHCNIHIEIMLYRVQYIWWQYVSVRWKILGNCLMINIELLSMISEILFPVQGATSVLSLK